VNERPGAALYAVRFTPAAERELHRLRPDDAARLRRPILGLAVNPRPSGVSAISGTPYLRLRLGDLRVIYQARDDERLVLIVRLARRSERTYRRLSR
jgi:mRNA interferase RelE/StbE